MLIRGAEVETGSGFARTDVRIEGAVVDAIATRLEAHPGEGVVDAGGGALLPGLHDHHIHLLSLAAALESVRCGPPQVADREALARALRAATPASAGGWIRGVGYHESVAGDLDAAGLSALAAEHPVRMQHRSGALWIVNEPGLVRLGVEAGRLPPDAPSGAERDARGCSTGRFYRCDAWLRDRLRTPAAPDLSRAGAMLARYGVTGVTDATPSNGASELAILSEAVARGALPLHVRLMGDATLPAPTQPGTSRGELKLILDEARQIDPDAAAAAMRAAHAADRAVAVHCVTRTELVVALAAFERVGARAGDRIEHASIAPPELTERMAGLGITVVTQPHFVRERGDAYLREVDADDLPWLYRCQGLLDAGVGLAGGTDAPFGAPDPWLAMQAAVERRTAAGSPLGAAEALPPESALALFTSALDDPGGIPRRIAPGSPADLCLLDLGWARARDRLDSDHVRATWHSGRPRFHREEDPSGEAPTS